MGCLIDRATHHAMRGLVFSFPILYSDGSGQVVIVVEWSAGCLLEEDGKDGIERVPCKPAGRTRQEGKDGEPKTKDTSSRP